MKKISWSLILILAIFCNACGRKDFENKAEVYQYSFDPPSEWLNLDKVKEMEGAFSGKNVCFLDTNQEYSVTFQKDLSAFSAPNPKGIKVKAMVKCPDIPKNFALVVSVEKPDSILEYQNMDVLPLITENNKWFEITTFYPIKNADPKAWVKCYFWNVGKGKIMIDDFAVEVTY